MYHPTGRVLTVLEMLQSRALTGPDLAARLETDVRTVRRYISKLQDVGIPVEATPAGTAATACGQASSCPRFCSASTKRPPSCSVSWEPVAGSRASPVAVEGALSKITRVMPQEVRDRVLAMSSVMVLSALRDENRQDASLLMLLGEAAQARQCLDQATGSERGDLTQRVVEPYGLRWIQGKWYLVGFCRLRIDYRTFRLDRIQQAVPREERFKKDEGFDVRGYAIKNLQNYPVNFRLRVLFKAPLERVQDRIPASLGTLTPTKDGVLLEWPIDDLSYGARYLLSRGVPFVVRDPPELRDAFRSIAADAARIAEAVG